MHFKLDIWRRASGEEDNALDRGVRRVEPGPHEHQRPGQGKQTYQKSTGEGCRDQVAGDDEEVGTKNMLARFQPGFEWTDRSKNHGSVTWSHKIHPFYARLHHYMTDYETIRNQFAKCCEKITDLQRFYVQHTREYAETM